MTVIEKSKKQRNKKVIIRTVDLAKIHISSSRLAIAVFQGLEKSPDRDSFDILASLLDPILDNEGGRLTEVILQNLVDTHVTGNGLYIILTKEKPDWPIGEENLPLNGMNIKKALDGLAPLVDEVVAELENAYFQDDEELCLREIVDEALEIELRLLAETVKSNSVYL